MPLTAHILPWRFGRGCTSWKFAHKIPMLVWTILLLLHSLSGYTQGANPRWGRSRVIDPRWRRSAGLSHMHRFVNTNGLDQEIHSTHDYQLLLDELSGDFGIKSDVVAAAFKEPEYHGSETVVVPLYIPRGAIPIRLARITRSGSPDVLPMVDLQVSASEDSLLLRRVGLPHQGQGRRLPPSRLMHPAWHTRSELNDKTRQPDVPSNKKIRTPPPPSSTPSFSIRDYGKRISKSDKEEDLSSRKEEIDQETTKRTKKSELSTISHFPGEISTTESSHIQRSTTKRPSFISNVTSEDIANTKTSVPKSKALITRIVTVPKDNDGASKPSEVTTETTTIAHLYKTSSTVKEINSTTESSLDTFSSSHANITFIKPSINSSDLHLNFSNITSKETNTFSPLKRTTKFIPVSITTTAVPEKKITLAEQLVSTERPEHHSVLFPRPVESILKSSHSKFTTSTPSTTTLTTTEVYTNSTTTNTSKIPLRNKIRIRPWLPRTQTSTSTSSTTLSPPPIPISTTTTRTTSTSTTHMPTTTKSPSRNVTIPSFSATTRKIHLITQKPPAFPIKFVSTNLTVNSTLENRSRIKEIQNGEKLLIESSKNIRNETKEVSEVNTHIKFPQSSTTERKFETHAEIKLKTSNKTNIDTEKNRPSESIALTKTETGDIREVITFSNSAREVEHTASTPPTSLSTINQEHSIRPNTRRVRKPKVINGRPVRRRRLFRHSTTSPAPNSTPFAKDLFSHLSTKSSLLSAINIPNKSFTTDSEATTIKSKLIDETMLKEEKVSRTPSKGLTFKSHEQVVLESLSEIMRDATNHSKDRVSNIATDLEALNKRLAERNIFIINAEVDGVKIKLNKTFARGTYPFPTTSEPQSSFNPPIPTRKSTIITRYPSTSSNIKDLSTAGMPLSPLEVRVSAENEESEKQVQTSVRSSFSMHTSKTTDIEDETEANHTYSPKSVDFQKDDDKFIRPNFKFTPTSISDEIVRSRTSDTLLKSTNTRQRQSITTSIATHSPENESIIELPIFISATATVPARVITRTRSTTIPINTHRPTLKPLIVTHKDRYRTVSDGKEEDSHEFLNISHENDSIEGQISDLGVPSVIHPTSHLRPNQNISIPASVAPTSGTNFGFTTSLSPKSPFFSIKEEQTDSSDIKKSAVEIQNSDSIPENKSSTTIYIVAVIGIIPAAVAVAFFFKRYLNKDEKSLPDAEEQVESFTPVTHHSRKPSQSNTVDLGNDSPGSRSKSEMPSSQYTKTPWEFPRSKLRLVSVLGEGNFGVVWKAEARDLCGCGEDGTGGPTVLVAVKSVKDGAGLKEREDLVKELNIMQHLGQHPNVVTLLGCCTQTEPHLVIMEYVMFGKLLTFLRDVRTRHKYYNFSADNEALTSKDLTRFACDVATGCEYLQSRGIIHRDLAARNILVDHNKVCKIADFGLARSIKDLGSDIYEQKSRGALPIRWMAPESLYMSIFTHKSDVWSFGILCWEIVTLGSTPYPGVTAREVMLRVQEGYRLDRPEHCRPELYHTVTKCWHQDLNQRPSFADIKLELVQLLDHQMGYVDLENFPEASYYSMHANNDEKL